MYLEDRAQLVPLLDLWLAVCGDQVECPERVLVEVGRLALNHFNGHDTQ